MKIRARTLSGTQLVDAWLRENPAALSFFPGNPRSLDSYAAKAREVDARFQDEDRARAAKHLVGGGPDAQRRLDAFLEGRGFMVTTGQQPGIFGGPLYGLYKGLTAAALARRLERELERPVLPIFWIASEDHGWDEVRGCHVLDLENGLHEVALPERSPTPSPPLHRIRLGPEIHEARDRFLQLLPDTDFSPRWRALLERAYSPGLSLADGFQAVMEELLGPAGVFLIQAHEPGLKARALPILLRELRESRERDEALRRVGADLTAAGFELQVPLLEGATNLFLEGPEGRARLFADGEGFRLRGCGTRLSLEDVEEKAAEDPAVLSPNVFLRPVVESALLPTLSYVAGPGEIAYLAQIAPVFEGHGVERPVVHPRLSLQIFERKVEKVLDKFELDAAELAQPHHELAGRLAREEMPPEIHATMGALRSGVASGAHQLARAVREVDPTLQGPVESFRAQSFGLLDDVERKVIQSLKRQKEITLAQVAKAQLHLFPLGKPQERVFNPFYYLMRYDREFLDQVAAEAGDAVLP